MIHDAGDWLSASESRAQVASRIAEGELTTWLDSSDGRILGLVTNGVRAMVVLMTGVGDAGEHAVDETAIGSSNGFVLDNGQVDEYPNQDTVPVDDALRVVASVVQHGRPPPDVGWRVDR
jgi:hypothetical protein